jgi:hypothetical protein
VAVWDTEDGSDALVGKLVLDLGGEEAVVIGVNPLHVVD